MLLLVCANLVPVYGVLVLGWEVFPLVLLFWLENVVIGVFNVLRLLCVRTGDGEAPTAKLFAVPFFTLHYGIFTLVHGVFVFVLFAQGMFDGFGSPLGLVSSAGDALTHWKLQWPLVALVGSHLFSFVVNFLLGGGYRRSSLTKVMARPYGRVVVLHVAILIGGFFAQALGSPIWALFLLIGLKLALDVRAHLRANASVDPVT